MIHRVLMSCLCVGMGIVAPLLRPTLLAEESRPAPSSDPEAAVRATVEGLIAADNAEDLAAVMAHYTEDVVFLPPDGPPVQGKAAIEPRYQALFADFDVELEVTIERMGVASPWAWCQGATRGRFSPRQRGSAETRQVHDKYLMVLFLTEQGSWRIHTLMWSPLPSP